jgi:hypothetical protein
VVCAAETPQPLISVAPHLPPKGYKDIENEELRNLYCSPNTDMTSRIK